MDLSKVKINDIVWVKRTGGHGTTGNADISIFKAKDGINITFRNNVIPSLTETGYVQVGMVSSALLFKESDRYTGHKPSKKATKTGGDNYYLSVSDKDLVKFCEKNNLIGDYHARLFKNYIYVDDACKIDY